ncbi:MAG: hypothetical protein AUJ06_00640 [Chloroflexi bacterium 13_1_40CM_3_70_6]|nr:MAG: hypothetical protein AUJ06_00640 [Chloroflexi bacterium 13_1_40CM_3_70_6]
MNWIGIILATVAAMVIGFLWYGQWGFGKSWMALVGRPMGQGQQPGPLYALTAVAALLEAITLSWFIGQTGWRTGSGGALIGLFAALGFTATAMFSEVLFAGRPARLYAINAGYQVFQAVVMGAIIGLVGA